MMRNRASDEIAQIVTFDCVSLYTSVDLKQTIDYILTAIYNEKDLFFPEETKTIKIGQEIKTEKVKPPNKNQVKRLFDAVCTKFNSFETHNGFYRQIKGCSMGS